MKLTLARFTVPSRSQSGRWWPALAGFVTWSLVGLTSVYWASRWMGAGPHEPVPVAPVRTATIDAEQVARALGAGGPSKSEAVPAEASSRHILLGVATDAAGHGVALISTDGQAAKAYRLGAALPDGLVLRTLDARQAGLATDAQAPASLRLDLPFNNR
jgi:general secretion pathway protein C